MTDKLPPGWARTTVGDVCLPVEKTDPRTIPDFEFEYIDISGIDAGGGRIRQTKSLRGVEAPSRARQVVREGDIVLSTVRTYQRKVASVPAELDCAIASTGFAVLRPARDVDSQFMLYQVLSNEFINHLNGLQTGTSYPAVRDKDVRAMQIRIAPITEQKRIVAAIEEHFSRLDAAETMLRQVLGRLDTLRSSILTDAFNTHRELPAGWEKKSIAEVAQVQLGRQRSPQHHSGEQMRPYLRAANVTWNGILLDDVKTMNFDDADFEKYRLAPGDLLLNEASGSPNEVGKPAIWDGQIEDCCFQNTLLRLRPKDVALRYLYWYCHLSAGSGKFGEAGRGVNIRHLGKQGLARFPIRLAPRAIQDGIAARIDLQMQSAEELQETVRAALDRVATLRRAVLTSAFSGRLVPQDPDDEPASALLERIAADRAPAAPRRRHRP